MANETTTRPHEVSPSKLWFGFTGTACAWVGLAVGDVLITWWACLQEGQQPGNSKVRPDIAWVYFAATLILLGLAVFAGTTSYANWKSLSRDSRLRDAEARGRQEFMALLGVFVSVTLGCGLVWLTIPLMMINLCVRTR
ncbi:MAG TPA: hypothetical protein VHZ07_02780 [Bryobacteraceae bacterium]|jgi:hypothetical protein|nr:hypothetical protein [Bryobacteraceae bacterium]